MNTREQSDILSALIDLAVALIVALGLIHLVIAPDYFAEAPYESMLFAASGIAAFVAAVGIHRGSKTWGWGLGLLVASSAMVMYVASHTVGLPGLSVDSTWFEPIGVLSLIVEGSYVVLALKLLAQNPIPQQDEPRLTAAG